MAAGVETQAMRNEKQGKRRDKMGFVNEEQQRATPSAREHTQLVDFSTYVTALLFLFLFFRAAGFQFVGHLVVTLAISEAKITPHQCRTSSSKTRQVYMLAR